VVANFIDDVLLSSSFENLVKIRYIVDESEGLGGKMRAIIMASRGQWICFLEDDDLFASNKLSVVGRVIETEENTGIIKNPVTPFNAMSKEMRIPDTKSLFYRLPNSIKSYTELRRKEYPYTMTFLPFRRKIISVS